MCIGYKEIERIDTSDLSEEVMIGSEVPKLFDVKEIILSEDKHHEELNHVKKVVANTVGRLLSDKVEKVKENLVFNPIQGEGSNCSNFHLINSA